jgi:serine/threonine protein kinase
MLPLTPTRLGRYEIVEEIGKGAMGVVYLARDPLIGRLVALKTFRLGYSVKDQEMEQFRVRFMREAQSAGILTHPNIVTIHDVVEASEEGLAFIAMEYVRGTNLKQILQSGQPLSLDFVVEIVSQVGEALDYAHSNRVIHRDVKPANILITEDRRVKITDFGIARIDTSNLTQEGQLLGTPNYMAPEQIQGKEVDYRADLFSLGVVLYEMLTRRKPFQGENLTVVSHRIVYDPFTPPRDFVKDLPPGVEKILERALEKDPARRYQRARDMADDLRRVLAQTTVRGDDLNETQSLAQTMVLPSTAFQQPPPPPPAAVAPAPAPRRSFFNLLKGNPAPAAVPPPPPDSGIGAATVGTGTGSWVGTHATMASAPPPPPPVAVMPTGAPMDASATMATGGSVARPRSRSVGRLLAAGLVALILSVLFWAGAFFWVRSQPAGPAANTQVALNPAQIQFARLMRQGEEALKAEEYDRAIDLFSQAALIAPVDRKAEAQKSRQDAEKKKVDEQKLQEAVAAGIAKARRNVKDQRFIDALEDVDAVIALDPSNPEARLLLQEIREEMRRRPHLYPPPPRETRSRTQEPPLATTPQSVPAVGAQPTEAEKLALIVDVEVHPKADGTLIVMLDDERLFSRDFKSRGWSILRNRREEQLPRSFSQTFNLLPDTYTVKAYFTPRNQSARNGERTVNVQSGDRRIFGVRVSESGDITVSLE